MIDSVDKDTNQVYRTLHQLHGRGIATRHIRRRLTEYRACKWVAPTQSLC